MTSYRSRSRSRRPTSGNYERRSSRRRHQQRATLPRQGHASRTFRHPSTSPRRFTHPIYARSTMSRHSSSYKTDHIIEIQHQLCASLEETVIPTLGDITHVLDLIRQAHYDYVQASGISDHTREPKRTF